MFQKNMQHLSYTVRRYLGKEYPYRLIQWQIQASLTSMMFPRRL